MNKVTFNKLEGARGGLVFGPTGGTHKNAAVVHLLVVDKLQRCVGRRSADAVGTVSD